MIWKIETSDDNVYYVEATSASDALSNVTVSEKPAYVTRVSVAPKGVHSKLKRYKRKLLKLIGS